MHELASGRVVLFAGAGATADLGYPPWARLLEELRYGLGDSATSLDEGTSLLERAQQIRDAFKAEGRLDDYYATLQETFGPKHGQGFGSRQQALVRLRTRGVVTTNYDPALEYAQTAANHELGNQPCQALDLCGERAYEVFNFLRDLGEGAGHRYVLHAHGQHRDPQRLVLTAHDYGRSYGAIAGEEDSPGSTPDDLDREGRRLGPLDTLHRRVLWSILVAHPVLFVGFSLDDPALVQLLDITDRDFGRGHQLGHFAIMGAADDGQRDAVTFRCREAGITPIIYDVGRADGLPDDHSGLDELLDSMAGQPQEPQRLVDPDRTESFSARMLEL